MSEQQVLADLKAAGSKQKLMQQYSDEMTAIVKLNGGNISDVPADKNHPYYQLQHKLQILNRLNV